METFIIIISRVANESYCVIAAILVTVALSIRFHYKLWAQATPDVCIVSSYIRFHYRFVEATERTMADVDKWSIDKLDLSNWMTWKLKIRHLLLAKDLWGLVDGMEVLRDDASAQQLAEFNKKSQKTFYIMVMSVSSS